MCLFSRRDGRRGLGNGRVGGDRRGRYSMVLQGMSGKKGENEGWTNIIDGGHAMMRGSYSRG
jgi:hypothetical protein